MRLARALVLFLFVWFLTSVANSQQPGEAPQVFKSRSDVVLVPVIVRDASGAHVSGLTKNDFTVLEHGKPQTIAVLEEVKTVTRKPVASTPPGVFTNQYTEDSAPQRVTIIALDMANTSFSDQAFARHQLVKFLSQKVDPDQPLALVAIYESGLRMLHDFTADRAALIAALKGVASVPLGPVGTGKVDRGVSQDVIRTAIAAGCPTCDPSSPAARLVAEEVERILLFQAGSDDEFGAMQRRSLGSTLESLQHVAQAFAGVPGKKSLIWITGGFPFSITKSGTLSSFSVFSQGTTSVTPAQTRSGVLGQLPDSGHILQDNSIKVLEPLYQQTLQVLASANIAVYPVDAAGLVSYFPGAEVRPVNLAVAREERERHNDVVSTLNMFASMTGGNACLNTNDLAGCFTKATRDTETYYLLGYYREQKNNKPGWRPLEVKVPGRGLHVRARSGYFYSNESPSTNSARQMDIALAVSSPVPYTALPFTVRWQKLPEPAQKGKQAYKFLVTVPPSGVSIAEKDNGVDMDFAAVAAGPKGEPVDKVGQHVTAQLKPEAVAQLRSDGLNYNNKLVLAPGKYTVRFVVRDNVTGRTGSVVAPISVD